MRRTTVLGWSHDTAGLSTEDQYSKEFQSITGQKELVEHGLLDQSNTVAVVANADRAADVRAAMGQVEGIEPPTEPVVLATWPWSRR